jgi:surface protein
LALTSVSGLENWKVSNVTNMAGMFESDQNLTSISSLSNWNTSSITDMSYLFWNNKKLMDLTPLSNWNTSRVTNMKGMFHNNVNLEDASAISNWDVSNVEDLSYFLNVSADAGDKKYSSLPVLNISSWNMSKVKNYNYFIESLEYVQTEFTIRNSNVESYNKMLTDCANKGGQVIINYTAETENIVDQMLTTVSSGGNVIKGSLVQ